MNDTTFRARGQRAANGCLEWQGARLNGGHGYCYFDGRMRVASRVAWVLDRGPIPHGMFVCHRCDNPACIDVDHLFLGTPKDNSQDMVSKGRTNPPRGERCGRARLTDEKVRAIKQGAAAGTSQAALARLHDIDPSAISRIVAGKRWSHIEAAA